VIAWLGDVASAWFWWVVICGFLLAIAAETVIPARQSGLPAWRWTDHLALYAACLILAGLIQPRTYVLALMPNHDTTLFGFVGRVGGETAVLISGLLLLDLFVYFLHWLQHVVFVLWRFHAVHHSDVDMDASTSMRHHPFAYLLTAVCVGVLFAVFGLPAWVFPIYGVILFLAALFQHLNVRLPAWLEGPLGLVLICPNMHRLHHSMNPDDYNYNFGNVLSIWDRLFGTLRIPTAWEEDRIVFGLDGQPDKLPHFWTWKMPFLLSRPSLREQVTTQR